MRTNKSWLKAAARRSGVGFLVGPFQEGPCLLGAPRGRGGSLLGKRVRQAWATGLLPGNSPAPRWEGELSLGKVARGAVLLGPGLFGIA